MMFSLWLATAISTLTCGLFGMGTDSSVGVAAFDISRSDNVGASLCDCLYLRSSLFSILGCGVSCICVTLPGVWS